MKYKPKTKLPEVTWRALGPPPEPFDMAPENVQLLKDHGHDPADDSFGLNDFFDLNERELDALLTAAREQGRKEVAG